jgi:hypothetical protein
MKKIFWVGLIVATLGWFAIPVMMFSDSKIVTLWISALSPKLQESYSLNLLRTKDEADYKKIALLEAWLEDLQTHGRNFKINEFTALVPLTKLGGEPLSEPLGLTAARVIIESRNCPAIGNLFAFYRYDEISTAEVQKRVRQRGITDCEKNETR